MRREVRLLTGRRGFLALAGAALVAGCSFAGSTLAVHPQGSLTDAADLAGLVLEVRGRTLAARADGSGLEGSSLEVPDAGSLEVRVELRQGGQLAASGSVRWELRDDYEWGLDVVRQVQDPMTTCFGCVGSASVALAAWAQRTPGEAIWLVWGGKPRGSDIVY